MITAITRPELYKHWNEAVKGGRPGVQLDNPKCGFYRTRKQRGGVWLPVAIWMQQEVDEGGAPLDDEYLVATIDATQTDPVEIWSWCKPITEEAFNHLTDPQPEAPIETQIQAGVDLTEAEPIF